MSTNHGFLTSIQNITLSLIFAVMEERRNNRTYDEYMAIAAALPPLKVLTFEVNQLLEQLHRCNDECKELILPKICRFKAGDEWMRITFESYPKKISYETVRGTLMISGMRQPRWSKARSVGPSAVRNSAEQASSEPAHTALQRANG